MLQSSVWVYIQGFGVNPTIVNIGVVFGFIDAGGNRVNGQTQVAVSLFAPRSSTALNMAIIDGIVAFVNSAYGTSITSADVVLLSGAV